MAGMKSRKEKRAASSGFTPCNKPMEIVEPERETPGRMAKAWTQPTAMIAGNDNFLVFCWGYFESKRRSAVKRKEKPTTRRLSNACLIRSFRKKPTRAIGTEAAISQKK